MAVLAANEVVPLPYRWPIGQVPPAPAPARERVTLPPDRGGGADPQGRRPAATDVRWYRAAVIQVGRGLRTADFAADRAASAHSEPGPGGMHAAVRAYQRTLARAADPLAEMRPEPTFTARA